MVGSEFFLSKLFWGVAFWALATFWWTIPAAKAAPLWSVEIEAVSNTTASELQVIPFENENILNPFLLPVPSPSPSFQPDPTSLVFKGQPDATGVDNLNAHVTLLRIESTVGGSLAPQDTITVTLKCTDNANVVHISLMELSGDQERIGCEIDPVTQQPKSMQVNLGATLVPGQGHLLLYVLEKSEVRSGAVVYVAKNEVGGGYQEEYFGLLFDGVDVKDSWSFGDFEGVQAALKTNTTPETTFTTVPINQETGNFQYFSTSLINPDEFEVGRIAFAVNSNQQRTKKYCFSVLLSQVAGFTTHTFGIGVNPDATGDGKVDLKDLGYIKKVFGKALSDILDDPELIDKFQNSDFILDVKVDLKDLGVLKQRYNKDFAIGGECE